MDALSLLKFTIDLTITETLQPSDLLVINSIGFAIIILSLSGRINYIFSDTYHSNQAAIDMGYPVLVFINRISYWGGLFVISMLLELAMYFNSFSEFSSTLLNISFLFTAYGFLAFSWLYLNYVFGSRIRYVLVFIKWLNS